MRRESARRVFTVSLAKIAEMSFRHSRADRKSRNSGRGKKSDWPRVWRTQLSLRQLAAVVFARFAKRVRHSSREQEPVTVLGATLDVDQGLIVALVLRALTRVIEG